MKLVLITALRDRLFIAIYALSGIAMAISAFLGSGAIIESSQMTQVFMAASARIALVLGLTVFVGFHVERMFDSREIEAILARSISRTKFIVAYWVGLAIVAFLLVVPVAAVVLAFHVSLSGTLFWALSFFCELLLVLAFALFAALTFERAIPTVLSTVGFYALSRSMSFLTSIAIAGPQTGVNQILNPYIEGLSFALPRFDLFSQTRWLVYGLETSQIIWIVILQTILYVPLLLIASSHDLARKHF